jgi:hypothetical protein
MVDTKSLDTRPRYERPQVIALTQLVKGTGQSDSTVLLPSCRAGTGIMGVCLTGSSPGTSCLGGHQAGGGGTTCFNGHKADLDCTGGAAHH